MLAAFLLLTDAVDTDVVFLHLHRAGVIKNIHMRKGYKDDPYEEVNQIAYIVIQSTFSCS